VLIRPLDKLAVKGISFDANLFELETSLECLYAEPASPVSKFAKLLSEVSHVWAFIRLHYSTLFHPSLKHYESSLQDVPKRTRPQRQEMARKIPWATDADSTSDLKPKRIPVQRARYEPRVSWDDDPASITKTSSQELTRKRETCKNGFCCACNVLTRLLQHVRLQHLHHRHHHLQSMCSFPS
jgi:hypothetical protein